MKDEGKARQYMYIHLKTNMYMYSVHINEKCRRKGEKSKHANNKAKQHTQGSHFSKEKLTASDGIRTHMYMYIHVYTLYMYMYIHKKYVISESSYKCIQLLPSKHSNKQCGLPSGSAAAEIMIPASTITAVTLIVMTGLPILIGW